MNNHGGSNNRVGGSFPQKWINLEVLIRRVVGKMFSKRIIIRDFRLIKYLPRFNLKLNIQIIH